MISNNIGICKNTGYILLISRLVTFTLFTLVDKDYLRISYKWKPREPTSYSMQSIFGLIIFST